MTQSLFQYLKGSVGSLNLRCLVTTSPFFLPDDKPLLVVTHGDLLSLDERARVRVHLGELLGIPPTTQIFDIPGDP